MNELRILTSETCRFFRSPGGTLQAEITDVCCCRQVVLRRLFPLRRPEHFISVADGKDEVGIIEDLAGFDAETRRLIREELDFFYAVPEILEIQRLTEEFGYYRWETRTDRGLRLFYVKGLTENVRFSNPARMYITDIHNSRYQIPDITRLPRASRYQLDQVY